MPHRWTSPLPTINTAPAPYIVYLLHADNHTLRSRHYVGITRVDNIRDRMRRHALGTGATLTRAWLLAGAKVFLVGVIPAFSYSDERHIKRQSHYARECPACLIESCGLPIQQVAGVPDLYIENARRFLREIAAAGPHHWPAGKRRHPAMKKAAAR